MLYFLETPELRFALLAYYRRSDLKETVDWEKWLVDFNARKIQNGSFVKDK